MDTRNIEKTCKFMITCARCNAKDTFLGEKIPTRNEWIKTHECFHWDKWDLE